MNTKANIPMERDMGKAFTSKLFLLSVTARNSSLDLSDYTHMSLRRYLSSKMHYIFRAAVQIVIWHLFFVRIINFRVVWNAKRELAFDRLPGDL